MPRCVALDAPSEAEDLNPHEITEGVASMSIRIVRAELLAGSKVSVFNSPLGGDEALVEQGTDPHPRTTSNGAVLSVSISLGKNNTSSRSIRVDRWIFFREADRAALFIRRRTDSNFTPVCGFSGNLRYTLQRIQMKLRMTCLGRG